LSSDVNPKYIRSIAIGPLDIVFELPLDNIPIYSEQSDTVVKGEALYYGWRAETDHNPAFFFVTLTTLNEKDQSSYSYTNVHELNKEEMLDVIWQLLDHIDDIHKQTLDVINPDTMTNGRLSDNTDYFH